MGYKEIAEDLSTRLSTVLSHFTSLSKDNYSAKDMILWIEDETYNRWHTQDDVRQMLNIDSLKELREALVDYFELSS